MKKLINGIYAVEGVNALFIDKYTIVNTPGLFGRFLREKCKDIVYTGGGDDSDYFNLPNGERLRVSGHEWVRGRSQSDIYLTRKIGYTGLKYYDYGRPVPYKRGGLRAIPDFEFYFNFSKN